MIVFLNIRFKNHIKPTHLYDTIFYHIPYIQITYPRYFYLWIFRVTRAECIVWRFVKCRHKVYGQGGWEKGFISRQPPGRPQLHTASTCTPARIHSTVSGKEGIFDRMQLSLLYLCCQVLRKGGLNVFDYYNSFLNLLRYISNVVWVKILFYK